MKLERDDVMQELALAALEGRTEKSAISRARRFARFCGLSGRLASPQGGQAMREKLPPALPTAIPADQWDRVNELIDALPATDALVARLLLSDASVREICEAAGISAVALRMKRERIGRELAGVLRAA